MKEKTRSNIQKLTLTAVMAALSYVVFTFLQIKIPIGGGDATSFHLGNAVCVLGALLLGGVYGGVGGAIGMTIGDLLDPVYVAYAPKTFILKLFIGLVTGFFAHRIGRITHTTDKKHVFKWSLIASVAGLLFNVIFDPLFGYLYNILIMGRDAADVVIKFTILTTSVNAVTSAIVAVAAYMPLRRALMASNLFIKVGKESDKESSSDK